MILGRARDGKSHLCQLLAAHLDPTLNENAEFIECSGVESHTASPHTWTGPNNMTITDTPGLMGTGGNQKDKENIVEIIRHVAELGSVNAICLVVNEQANHFEDRMKDAVKLLIGSFHVDREHICIVFNKSNGEGKEQAIKKKSLEQAKAIANRIYNQNAASLDVPSWQFSYDYDALIEMECASTVIDKRMVEMEQALSGIIEWAKAKPPIDTRKANIKDNALQQIFK